MSHLLVIPFALLVIPFADVQKAKEGANKLLSLQKRGQIEIEDAIVAMKNENGAVELKQLSNASSFWEIRAAASGHPAPTLAGALTDSGGNEKFVKELAKAMPLGRGAVVMSVGKGNAALSTARKTAKRLCFSTPSINLRPGAVRGGFCKVERGSTALIKVKELSLWKRRLFVVSCSVENHCDV
jgi:uncharacterized membrane protein